MFEAPEREGRIAQCKTTAVMPMPEQVHFYRNTGRSQRSIVFHTRFHRHQSAIGRVIDKRRRSLTRHVFVP